MSGSIKPHGMRTMGMKTPKSGIRAPRIASEMNTPPLGGTTPPPAGGIAPTQGQIPETFPNANFPTIGFSGKGRKPKV